MRNKLLLGVAAAALLMPVSAWAQSTGTVDAEGAAAEVVVTGARTSEVGGVQTPDTPKARSVLTQEFISRQTPGQSILETINQVPGVSFQNNDPFGSAGGTLTIRGFDSSRISLTFDGIPLNDTGNYALYSNQQLDPELISQVNVNLGTTDVDSPTASATGSTVNYRTINPTEEFGARALGSVGDFSFFRVFGLINTGEIGPFGTRAWFSASHAENDVVFNDRGRIDKQQYNAKIYQPIGSNGDFIAIAGHYNQNRNNFFGSAPLRNDDNVLSQNTTTGGATPLNPILVVGAPRTPGTGSSNRFPRSRDELPYSVPRCTIDVPQSGVADATNTCGTTFDERYNPSNTGNVRVNSRFTLADNLVFTADGYYQYTKANGGGTVTGREGVRTIGGRNYYGFIGGAYYFGRDLNGDGDTLDTCSPAGSACGSSNFNGVTLLAPSQTQTDRYGVIAGLRYDFTDTQSLRLNYTLDYGDHRQTGETGLLQPNGEPFDVFPVNSPLAAANGVVVQKRDRASKAILNQVSGEYRGQFLDEALTVQLGLRAPFFKRKLNNFCFVTAANGNVDCLGDPALIAAYAAANPYAYNGTTNAVTGFAPPQRRTYKYDKLLPNVGLTYKFADRFSVFASYSKGIQVPGTDNLYQAFYYPQNTDAGDPQPETTDNFDAGLRYTSSKIQAFVGPWYTRFTNRLAGAFDQDTQQTIYRNLGRVDKYGIDGSIAYRPIPEVLVYVFGSYLKSEIKNDVQIGVCSTATTVNCAAVGNPIFAQTEGKRESGAPVYTVGGRLQATLGPVDLGVQAKRTGKRYLNDQNLAQYACTASLVNTICPTAANTTATFTGTRGFQYGTFGATAPGYTTVDLDARVSLEFLDIGRGGENTFIQLNVQNVFNKFYVGGFSGGQTLLTSVPFVQIGSPRAFTATLSVGL
jgi:iron complex outermembrane recepter protein